jgi:hypothetical protein
LPPLFDDLGRKMANINSFFNDSNIIEYFKEYVK